jgi:hypothetical protein
MQGTEMMNTGKIMIGFSLVMLSVAMMVSPSGATGQGISCEVGCGNTQVHEESGYLTGIKPVNEDTFINNEPGTNATYPYER